MLSNLTPIVSLWIPKDVKQLSPNSHILPNTLVCPYRSNFINCAKQNPGRKMVLVALTRGLTPKQVEKAKSIERESPNIVFMPLQNINLGKYDLHVKIGHKSMKFSTYLKDRHNIKAEAKLPLAIEIDLVRIILGLKGCEFLLEAGISQDELPEEKSLIISDLDILPQEEIKNAELSEDIALLEVVHGCKQLENGLLVIRKPEHTALVGLYRFMEEFLSSDRQGINPSMIFTAQLLVLIKYFDNDKKASTVKEIIAYLEQRKGATLSIYGLDIVINGDDFQEFMWSDRCKFRYNNGEKKFSHEGIELNSSEDWKENLYDTEIRESGDIEGKMENTLPTELSSISVSNRNLKFCSIC